MPKPIVVTEDLLTELNLAQQKHTASILSDPYNRFGDDWGDYTNAALEMSQALFNMVWDESHLEALDLLLNTPPDLNATSDIDYQYFSIPRMSNLASDGIASIFYTLNCPALPKED